MRAISTHMSIKSQTLDIYVWSIGDPGAVKKVEKLWVIEWIEHQLLRTACRYVLRILMETVDKWIE